jgi:hypothetical protein
VATRNHPPTAPRKAHDLVKHSVWNIEKATAATNLLAAAVDRGLGHWEEPGEGKGTGRKPSRAFVLAKPTDPT